MLTAEATTVFFVLSAPARHTHAQPQTMGSAATAVWGKTN